MNQKIKPLLFDTYMAVIKNSVGTNMFRNFYANVNDDKKDIMQDGNISCAFFVSSILTFLDLTERIHGTVDGVIYDLQKSGWKEINNPKPGSILIWEALKFESGETHKHIGFYIGNEEAISNNHQKKQPTIHHWKKNEKGEERKINHIFWCDKLEI